MPDGFTSVLDHIDPENDLVVDVKRHLFAQKDIYIVKSISEDLKNRIRLSAGIKQYQETPSYFMFLSYCYVIMNQEQPALTAASNAIELFSLSGQQWHEAIGHWFKGLVYRHFQKFFLYREELSKSLEIASVISKELLIESNYGQHQKCKTVIEKLQEEYAYAIQMEVTEEPQDETASNEGRDEGVMFGGHINLTWIPIFQSVRAGPTGMIWVDPPKEDVAWVSTISIRGKLHRMHALRKTAHTDQQITIIRDLSYGLAQVKGQSMNAHQPVPIEDNDFILFYKSEQLRDGDIVVASRSIQNSGEDAYMVKKFREMDHALVSETSDTTRQYPDVKYNKDCHILGIVIAVAKPI